MKKQKTIDIKKICALTIIMIIMLFSVRMIVCAEGENDSAESDIAFESVEKAYEYADGYNDNLMNEPEVFSDKLEAAITMIREDVRVYGTVFALLPPIIAIGLALITKEVYSSLFVGIISGALLYTWFNPVETLTTAFSTIIGKLSDSWNIGIIMFLVILGIFVSMMNKAGGSAAYGEWASKKIKNKSGANLATLLLGVMIFVDDYFNCLTVGSVMRPVMEKHHISKEKLAYLIDATAAPVCIIAPISSWAAAVTSIAPEGQGLKLFVRSIPYNFYALLTIVMIITISIMKFDYGPMKKYEKKAENGEGEYNDNVKNVVSDVKKGKVIDLILPVAVLVVCCIIGMIYTGGFFEGVDFISAFANSDASIGLVLGSFVAFLFSAVYYLLRKSLTFKEIAESFTDGFKAMVPAIMILSFAWGLSGITMNLGAKVFVAEVVRVNAANLTWLLPCIVFAIGVGLAFATGTSWGTFGILLPIVCAVFPSGDELLYISISACLAGAVCGDHCSPISDTTIMASAGAGCNHINHVSTQLPYALTVAAVSFVTFIIAGLTKLVYVSLPIGILLMIATIFAIKMFTERKKEA